MTPREYVKQFGFSLVIGQTKSIEYCPFCEGGVNRDRNTCGVTRDSNNLVLYNCKRVKCNARGRILASGAGYSQAASMDNISFKPNPYTKPCEELAIDAAVWISEKWHLDLADVYNSGWVLASKEAGFLPLVIPVLSYRGTCRGHVLRIQGEDDSKQVRNFKQIEEPWLGWYRKGDSDILVVEDPISAFAASEFCTGVSLCGTEISPDKFEEILAVAGARKIWIALDKDAVKKGFEYLKRYRLYCPNLNVLMIPKDIKNMTYEERKALGGPFTNG